MMRAVAPSNSRPVQHALHPSVLVPGFVVQATLGALRELDLNVDEPTRTPQSQADPASLSLPLADFDAMLARASVESGDPALGLRIARHLTEANMHLLGPLFVASRSMREGFEHVTEVLSSMFGDPPWRLRFEGAAAHYACVYALPGVVLTQLAIALIHRGMQQFVTAKHQLEMHAHFQFAKPADCVPYENIFGSNVHFDASQPSVSVPLFLLEVPRLGTDPAGAVLLRQMACERFLRERSQDTWAARVEQAVREQGNLAMVDVEYIARRWGVTARLLRRHVRAEGETLTALVNRIRYERARALLENSSASIADVARAMGYSEPSAFHRAFKRWTGQSAQTFRLGRR
jgi:AraC-like DNA-binding protein